MEGASSFRKDTKVEHFRREEIVIELSYNNFVCFGGSLVVFKVGVLVDLGLVNYEVGALDLLLNKYVQGCLPQMSGYIAIESRMRFDLVAVLLVGL